jgi:hypothetical protein
VYVATAAEVFNAGLLYGPSGQLEGRVNKISRIPGKEA